MTESWNNRILNIYKPVGITSYSVVRQIKNLTGLKKVGHGGTLDPFAEGVLLILTGQSTKKMRDILELSKSYEAILVLGESTQTGDNTAEVNCRKEVPEITSGMLQDVKSKFMGEILQVPPMYSAKKIDGKRLYKYARSGITVQREPVKIKIYDFDLSLISSSEIEIKVTCSKGTYIRVLGEDIAKLLGTVGHLRYLKRTCIGNYSADDSLKLDAVFPRAES